MAARKSGKIPAGYEDDYIECRGPFRHYWVEIEDDGTRLRKYRETNTNRRHSFQCPRCTTRKWCVWNRFTGDNVCPPAYSHPSGYKLAGTLYARTFKKAFMERQEQRTPKGGKKKKAA